MITVVAPGEPYATCLGKRMSEHAVQKALLFRRGLTLPEVPNPSQKAVDSPTGFHASKWLGSACTLVWL